MDGWMVWWVIDEYIDSYTDIYVHFIDKIDYL